MAIDNDLPNSMKPHGEDLSTEGRSEGSTQDEESPNVLEDKPEIDNTSSSATKRWMLLLLLLAVIGGAVAVAVTLTSSKDRSSTPSNVGGDGGDTVEGDDSVDIDAPVGSESGDTEDGAASMEEPEEEACLPWNDAAFIEYDPSGVTAVIGSTLDAAINLPTKGQVCGQVDTTSNVVWFKIQVAQPATVLLTTCSPGTEFSTVLSVYQDDTSMGEDADCQEKSYCLGSNNNHELEAGGALCAASPNHSAMEITAETAGETFLVAVSGADATEFGQFVLQLSTPPPAVDLVNRQTGQCLFDEAVAFHYDRYAGTTLSGNTFYGDRTLPNDGVCSFNVNSQVVWFKFEPEYVGTFLITTCSAGGTSFDTVLTVFHENMGEDGDCSATCVASNDDHSLEDTQLCSASSIHSAVEFTSHSETDVFYVALSGFHAGSAGFFDVHFRNLDPLPALGNGDCPLDTATVIPYNPNEETVIHGSTAGAISTLPSNNYDYCGVHGSKNSPTVWYQFETNVTANILLTTCSDDTDFDTVLTVYQRSTSSECNVYCLGANNDQFEDTHPLCSGSRTRSAVEITSHAPGDTFYVAVSGHDATRFGDFALRLITTPLPNV